MSTVVRNKKGDQLVLSDPYKDIERFSGKSFCYIDVIFGDKSGEGAQIEEFKIYDSIINLLSKEI